MKKILCDNLDDIYNEINKDFNSSGEKIKVDLIYAFNGTGKTMLSRMFSEKLEDKVLCFNSMFQDEFIWDNDNFFLTINHNSWITRFIQDQGLENAIENNFIMFCGGIIEPSIDLNSRIIEFSVKTQNGYESDIKVSKAEENIFIWTIFYTFID